MSPSPATLPVPDTPVLHLIHPEGAVGAVAQKYFTCSAAPDICVHLGTGILSIARYTATAGNSSSSTTTGRPSKNVVGASSVTMRMWPADCAMSGSF